MEKKVRQFVYSYSARGISLGSLKSVYYVCIFLLFFLIVMGIAGRSIFPVIATIAWSLLFWIFILTIQSKRTKKTFELQFLVNGMTGVFISSLVWILFATVTIVSDPSFPFPDFDFALWIVFFYLLFSAIYIALIVIGVHKGLSNKPKSAKRFKNSSLLFLVSFSGGAGGVVSSQIMRRYTSDNVRSFIAILCSIMVIFLPILAHINFLQYYYCKKYGVTCGEYGNSAFPGLEDVPLRNLHTNAKSKKKKFPLPFKILIGILAVPVALFVILFIVAFIKAIATGG